MMNINLQNHPMAPDLLTAAQKAWNQMDDFRRERERCKRFTYGDQWGDLVSDRGRRITEAELILDQGNLPLKNNLIRRLVRNVLGVFRNQNRTPRCLARDMNEAAEARTMQLLLDCNAQLNRLDELYARSMEEFLISGMVVHKKWYGRKGSMADCHTDIITPDRFFVDASGRDLRGGDISIIGEIHLLREDELLATFANSASDAEMLYRLYNMRPSDSYSISEERFRVYEIWHRRRPARYLCRNLKSGRVWKVDADKFVPAPDVAARWICDDEWHCSFLTPDGKVIFSAPAPYAHGGHPYVMKAYPFIDGEIHSFVADIIDQQKFTNRLISMYDWILRSSAKGVLLFPEGSLPDGVDIDDIADEWSRFNGVIVYRPRPGVALPQQVSSKSTDVGITELLEIQMKMMEDISGVNGALQGKLDSNSMSGTLYNQQTRNSLTALADLLRSFDDFILRCAAMDASNIRQFYSPRRIEAIAGSRPGLAPRLSSSRSFFHSPYDFTFPLPAN